MFTNTWRNIKAWFKHSETIFIERCTVASGFVMAGIAAMDWSPLFSIFGTGTAFNKAELYGLGALAVTKGLFGEWARRRSTIEVDSKLIPTSIVKEVKTEVVAELPPEVLTTTDTVKS